MKSAPLRIGVPAEYNISELDPLIRQAWSRSLAYMQRQGHTIHSVSLPATKLALSAYYVLAPAEASSNLAKYDGVRYGTRPAGPDGGARPDEYLYASTRGGGFGTEVKRRILLGAFSLSADAIDNYFMQAQRIRRLVQHDFNAVFSAKQPLASLRAPPDPRAKILGVDVLMCPTVPSAPPRLSDLLGGDTAASPLDAYMNDVFTVPASLAGLPAVSVPITVDKSAASTGIQIIGQYGDDELVLRVGESLEGKNLR